MFSESTWNRPTMPWGPWGPADQRMRHRRSLHFHRALALLQAPREVQGTWGRPMKYMESPDDFAFFRRIHHDFVMFLREWEMNCFPMACLKSSSHLAGQKYRLLVPKIKNPIGKRKTRAKHLWVVGVLKTFKKPIGWLVCRFFSFGKLYPFTCGL